MNKKNWKMICRALAERNRVMDETTKDLYQEREEARSVALQLGDLLEKVNEENSALQEDIQKYKNLLEVSDA